MTAYGKNYKTVEIAGRIWTAENLAYRGNGENSNFCRRVPWDYLEDGFSDTIAQYGCLYEWGNAQNICPQGWHLPTENEFYELQNLVTDDLGTHPEWLCSASWASKIGDDPETYDLYGFAALAAGGYFNGHYQEDHANFMGSSLDGDAPVYMQLDPHYITINSRSSAGYALSVRCVKDAE